ncbi:MAG: LacI family transcriptional regulator [Kiritimatiellales bacterium]|nr:LacI family transcriptional regulator [Kiritimatiellales bacterium]
MSEAKSSPAVTIKEVAEMAGVHRTVASKILNNSKNSRISEVTRKRVLRVAKRLNFESEKKFSLPDETVSFGLLSGFGYSRKENPFFSDVFDGIAEEAEKRGLNIYVINSAKRLSFRDLYQQEHFLGVIAINPDAGILTQFEVAKLPLVGIEAPHHLSSSLLYSIRTDSFQGAYNSTRYLIECGHRNIHYLGYSNSAGKELMHSLERFEGVAQALKESGLFKGHKPVSVPLEGGNSAHMVGESLGYAAMKKLLGTNPPKPFACVCFADTHAEGAYRAVRESGLHIPGDVSFVGYDNLASSSAMAPPLTTIDVPRYELGKAALTTLLEIEEGHADHDKVLATQLITRSSVLNLNG